MTASSDLCEQCRMPDGRHTSDCPIRLAKKAERVNPIVADLTRWRTDPDVKLIIQGALIRHEAKHIGDLPDDVISDLHEAIKTLLEESPTIDTLGDPRRMR